MGILRVTFKGYHIIIPNTLNNICVNAICQAATGFDVTTVADIIPVTVVPTLAPSVKGNISFSGIKPIATRGVITDVVIDDDCTIIVRNIPISIETYPLYDTDFLNHLAAVPLTRIFNDLTIKYNTEHIPDKDKHMDNIPATLSDKCQSR